MISSIKKSEMSKIKKIKICHIVEATGGGVRTHLLHLASGIDTNSFEQFFIVSTERNSKIKEDLIPYIQEDNIFIINMSREINFYKDFISIIQMVNILRKANFDIIHCHSAKAGFLGRVSNLLSGRKKSVYTPHAFPFHNYMNIATKFLYISLEKIMGRFTDNLIAVSESEAKTAVNYNIVQKHKIRCIENAVPNVDIINSIERHEFFFELIGKKLSSDTIVCVFLGRLTKQKNPFFIIELAKESGKNAIFILAGDGEYYTDLKKDINNFCLQEKVFIIGHISNVNEFLFYADLLILPSLWEGLPYSILEAMNVGTPVFASNIDGNRDIVINGENGYLFALDSANEVIKIIQDTSVKSLQEMGNSAKQLIREKYELKRMISNIEDLYLELMKENIKSKTQ
jgi:glycosyltransferase involved in cell wall biosynthesis